MLCPTIKVDFVLYKTLNQNILRYWASGEGWGKGENHTGKGKTLNEVLVGCHCGDDLGRHTGASPGLESIG